MGKSVYFFLLSGLFCCLGFSDVIFFAVWAGACFFCFLLFGRVGVFIFCCLGGWRVVFFAVWAGGVFFFAVWAGACSFFAVWAGACSFFCCLGRGHVFFFCCLGGGREFTHLPVCLARL